jgi:rhomboid family GlyGly-CTERM serine protease
MHANPGPKQWALCLVISALCLMLAFMPESLKTVLRFQSNVFESGDYWRLFTAHFVHLGWSHTLLNVTGLLIIWKLYGALFNVCEWLIVLTLSSLSITVSFVLLDHELQWYVGLSGLLHALLSCALVYTMMISTKISLFKDHWQECLLLIALVFKLIQEQYMGALPYSKVLTGGEVIVNAHLYGTIAGCVSSLILFQFTTANTKFEENKNYDEFK